MSRIGKQPINIPSGVDVKVEGNLVKVKGPKGQLQCQIHQTVAIESKGGVVTVTPRSTANANRCYHGLSRTLIANMVEGVSAGFTRNLTIVGVGYRAQMSGKDLDLALGFSHPILFKAPAGIEFKVDKRTDISVLGIDKELVGRTAAKIRSFRPPEPYHGKGVRYVDEHVVTKVGKAGAK